MSWQSTVAHIHPMINPGNRTGVARLHINNSNLALKPNMLAHVSISIGDNQPVLQIPTQSLIRTSKQNRVVLALGEGRFKSIAVQVGRFSDDHVEIIAGLSLGDSIVSSAQFLLDSESSKTSDFQRMQLMFEQLSPEQLTPDNQETMPSHDEHGMTNNVSSAMVHGTVISAMLDHRMVTIDREAITKWQRPAAVVDFIVDSSVDMALFSTDAYLMFTFEIHEGEFVIVSAMEMNADTSHKMSEKMPHKMHVPTNPKLSSPKSSNKQKSSHHDHSSGHDSAHQVEPGMNKVYTK
jgi:Cu(I)/Ag(I) efflux system membrane fusion protein